MIIIKALQEMVQHGCHEKSIARLHVTALGIAQPQPCDQQAVAPARQTAKVPAAALES
ncbi:MAG: hypothetical protein BWX66_00299 [Deltaproteobacteria bacterium ADurb.Bin058]|nr:MAG: hypothetical protein BWX66_01319 [Deltaproteobacteria bacterium ADurb.Bin058]OQC42825.1 MAG: hypothetical protein BWX66_00299 [Deltaproteobacteria bacterium ADurb.Bin058]